MFFHTKLVDSATTKQWYLGVEILGMQQARYCSPSSYTIKSGTAWETASNIQPAAESLRLYQCMDIRSCIMVTAAYVSAFIHRPPSCHGSTSTPSCHGSIGMLDMYIPIAPRSPSCQRLDTVDACPPVPFPFSVYCMVFEVIRDPRLSVLR
jgi:hypothetical protein